MITYNNPPFWFFYTLSQTIVSTNYVQTKLLQKTLQQHKPIYHTSPGV